ncbi:MAG: serine--tRNA ligase [Actinobacteria bacterium]|nr:serine--tRNA ligase [Actinomycetota bacterium]
MIDVRLLRDEPERVRASQRARRADPGLVDAALAADEARRGAIGRFEALRAEQRSIGAGIPSAAADEKAALLARTKDLAVDVKAAQVELDEAEAAFDAALRAIDNVIVDGVPEGGEEDFVVLDEIGTLPDIADPRDHLAIGEALGMIDVERGVKVSGSRFYYLTGWGARLELALVNLAMAQAIETGFTPMVVPALVRPAAMEGTGFLGQAAENVYRLEADDLYLVGTAEVPLAGYHMGEVLDGAALPLRYAGLSPCFRREAGTYGKDTRGIFRVHQFDKVEMFSYTHPDDAEAEHERLLGWEKRFLSALELPFRVIDVAAGDLGASAARKFDCEAWIPSQGRYRELTSASNCTTFQSRRLDIRARGDDGRPAPVATLNGTLCAVTRTIVALLENHQQPDGSVRVPAALQPHLGVDTLRPGEDR